MREETLRCPNCGLNWQPARLKDYRLEPSERDADGRIIRFGRSVEVLLPKVRCVECKEVYDRPVPTAEPATT